MNSRIGMILVFVVFVASPITAWFLHSSYEPTPGQGKNKGMLIHPARPLDKFSMLDEQGVAVGNKPFLGQWSMMLVATSPCVENCKDNIYRMRQIRLALGKDAYRVQRVIATKDKVTLADILPENPGTLVFELIQDSENLLKQFPGYTEGGIPSIAGRIYIVDPFGNLMMSYEGDSDASNILSDMRQLLKASWIRPKT